MGSSHKEAGSDMVLTDVTISTGDSAEGSFTHSQQQHNKEHQHRKKHKKKKGDGALISNNDSDIVTPYQNGHYLQPQPRNGYNNRQTPRLTKSISNDDDIEDDLDNTGEGNLLAQSKSTSYGDFLSPQPTLHNILLDERGVHSSLSVNNAITVAPSRNNLTDSNVFAGGRPNNFKRPNNHRSNRHHKHKGRSRTPDFTSGSRLPVAGEPQDSILNRIDLSIRKHCGDWDGTDDTEVSKKLVNGNAGISKPSRTPYFIPKSVGVSSDSDLVAINGKDEVNLPRLFKSYDTVVSTSKQVLHDTSYKLALSKDNADPNSILSQAKKTLSYVSGPCQS